MSYQFRKAIGLLLFGGVLLLLLGACKTPPEKSFDFSGIEQLVYSGELQKAELLANSIKATGTLGTTNLYKLDSIVDIGNRIRIDFVRTEAEIKDQLSKYYPVLDSTLFNQWETTQKLEMRLIDGEKRYFKNAVANLFRLDDDARKQKEIVDGFQVDSLDLFRLEHTRKIISVTRTSGETVLPVRMKLTYSIDVDVNAIPDGKMIRCWMPFPREGNARQKNLKLISTEPENAKIASNKNLQRSVYLEKRAKKDQPTIFRIEFEVETSAQYFDLNSDEIKPYDTESSVYKENTYERAPQIVFTPKIKKLGHQILAGETNPLKKVQKIYNWINDSIRWASALEYSIMPDIPGYVMETRHGDCGMQTLLFMTLARSQGIPAKWQSGWMLHPGEVNLHDWCEVYFEGVGWVPVDQSFGLQDSQDEKVRNFYRSGIDSYRLIVNDDYARELSPKKKYPRSEPYDFQRGELEGEGGNLYFNKWSWNMEVEYK
ncbi:MAG: transglutaminase-like domain-containing protein [Bacteroidota bacterium]|nr:transglutaminase-like domain-containing protein [Bacteroidota bacterium]